MTSHEIIEATRRCAEALRTAGHSEWSTRLINVIESGSTGGETLMGIRHHLREVLENDPGLSAELLTAARQIIEQTNATGW